VNKSLPDVKSISSHFQEGVTTVEMLLVPIPSETCLD